MNAITDSIYEDIFIIGMGTFPVAVYDLFTKYGTFPRLIECGPESSYFKYLCTKKSIKYKNLSRDQLTKLLGETTKLTLVVSSVNKYIFPNEILSKPNIVAINYHNSILPKHRGSHAEAFAIFDMDEYTGSTWHYVAKEVDRGNIIAENRIKISRDETSISLLSRQNEGALKLLETFLPNLLSNKISDTKKVASGGEFHLSKDLPSNGILNFEWSINKVYAFLRSFDYGELELIGRPCLVYGGHRYTWRAYSLVPEKCSDSGIVFDANKHTVEIRKTGSIDFVRLHNVEMLEQER